MSSHTPLLEKNEVVVGKPLPFSVFGADGKLLLAKGRVVETARLRELLLSNGTHRSAFDSSERQAIAMDESPVVSPLAVFRQENATGRANHRIALTIAADDSSEAFNTWMIGVHGRILILAAPLRSDGSMAVVIPNHECVCRTFQETSVFKFRGKVLKVVFDPFQHVLIELVTEKPQMRPLRKRRRISVFIPSMLNLPGVVTCVVIDLSAGGARIAVEDGVQLARDQSVSITAKLEMLEFKFELTLKATVVGIFGASEKRHSQIVFYGIRFDSLSELDSLVLHGFVNSAAALEMNGLWQMLTSISPDGVEPVRVAAHDGQ
jgi:hypothetical protein